MSVKGDWSRVKDAEAYRDNYDNIFRKKEVELDVPKVSENDELDNDEE